MSELMEDRTPVREVEEDSSSRERRTPMTAADALEKIRRGAAIHDAEIEGLRFTGTFTAPVKFKNCLLVKPRFDGATFEAEVEFVACTLDRPYFSRPTLCQKNLSLQGSTVNRFQVTNLRVEGDFLCGHLHARGTFEMGKTVFKGRVDFWEAHFTAWVNFKKCEFYGEADFRSLRAEQGFVLRECKFAQDVKFRGASIAMKCDLTGTRVEALLDFSKAKLHDYVYLETLEMGEKMRFAFANALGERVLVAPEQIAGRLASEESGDYHSAMHEYAFLKRSYGSLHRYDQEDWAFHRFKVNQRRAARRSWWRPWTKLTQFCDWLFLDHGCGYCTNPYRAVRTALVIMLGFAIIYTLGIDYFHLDSAKLPFPNLERTHPANAVTIGMLTSVSVFTSGVGGIREMAQSWMNIPLMVESLLGTLLWGLFIVAFSRKVIR
jgi:hypothetical protein